MKPIANDPLLFVGGISRSGTTLLTTVLDAHPQILMGAELIPPQLPRPSAILQRFAQGMQISNGDYKNAGRALRNAGEMEIGQFLTRCYRAGIAYNDAQQVLAQLDDELADGVKTLRDRLVLAWSLMQARWQQSGGDFFGFKLNTAGIAPAAGFFPNARFICIVRQPYDVVYSQTKRGFKRSVEEIAAAWVSYTRYYSEFAKDNGGRCVMLRYEDLVRSPRRTLINALGRISIPIDEAIFEFYKNNSAIQDSHHPNTDRLRMNFATDAIGSGRAGLAPDHISVIDKLAAKEMHTFGYMTPSLMAVKLSPTLFPNNMKPNDDLLKLSSFVLAKNRMRVKLMHRYKPSDYGELLEPYRESHRNLRLADFIRLEDTGDDRFLLIRHDIDHDIEMAVKLAEWEHRNNIRSTFCILHSTWYYGEFENGSYKHSSLLLECIEQIAAYGHEINLHNNLVVMALTQGIDPARVLREELAFFDRKGLPIIGTSTHGDSLCRQMNFRNWELFRECCDERFGGPRTLSYESKNRQTNTLDLGQLSMFDFGLEYEAYDIARDVYHTDSGGRIRTRTNTRGRRSFGRKGHDGQVVGVLTHPEWWDF